MILAEIPRSNRRYPHISADPDLQARCDECEKEFVIERCKKSARQNKRHFCSKRCSISSFTVGKIRRDIQEGLAEKGYVNFSQRPDVREKIEATNLEKFGAKSNLASEVTKEKRRLTWRAKYGVDIAAKSDVVRRKTSETWSTMTPDEKEKINRKRVETVAGMTEEERRAIKDKIRLTCLSRYGVESPLQMQTAKDTCNSPEACRRRFETMKRNGSYGKSLPEDTLYRLLIERFGQENVQRQVTLSDTRWPIDFYVRELDAYVQYDGAYWHGIGRQMSEVAEHKTKRDIMIHRKMLIDAAQNEWFSEHGFTLVRISGVSNDSVDSIIREAEAIRLKKSTSIAQAVK